MLIQKSQFDLLAKLIECVSVTPHDHGAQFLIKKYLENLFFTKVTSIEKKINQTTNSLIKINFNSEKTIIFVGHTDVVPAQESQWAYAPFKLTIQENKLIGRGIADMKGAIVAFIAAIENLYSLKKDCPNVIFLLTSDEEGSGKDGLQTLLDSSEIKENTIAIIGEPTSQFRIGDCVKIGRRGSLHCLLELEGESYHVAYPGKNHPIYYLDFLIRELKLVDWDQGLSINNFESSSFQITKIETEDSVENVIPSKIMIRFNIRYSPVTNLQKVEKVLENILETIPLKKNAIWKQGATPWHSELKAHELNSILKDVNVEKFTTDGGVSDGYKVFQFFTQKIIEIGLKNETAHQKNEYITLDDLKDLISLYEQILINVEENQKL